MALQNLICGLIGTQKYSRYFSTSQNCFQGIKSHAPNNLERKFLVWTGKFKTIADVPPYVSNDVMERCRNQIRIRVASIMMIGTVIGCIAMVISGKNAASRGDSVTKQNLEWHKIYNEQQKEKAKE